MKASKKNLYFFVLYLTVILTIFVASLLIKQNDFYTTNGDSNLEEKLENIVEKELKLIFLGNEITNSTYPRSRVSINNLYLIEKKLIDLNGFKNLSLTFAYKLGFTQNRLQIQTAIPVFVSDQRSYPEKAIDNLPLYSPYSINFDFIEENVKSVDGLRSEICKFINDKDCLIRLNNFGQKHYGVDQMRTIIESTENKSVILTQDDIVILTITPISYGATRNN